MTKHATAQPRRLRAHEGFALTLLTALMSQAYAQQAPAASQQLDTVVVTGIRSSLAASAKAKRDDVGLSENVFAEDMGKFPEPNIADALSRVPGVNITRAHIDGEGLNISIRGMGAAFTRVLLNGAPVASASAGSWGGNISANRETDIDFLPSELFSSASVYKSQRASILDGGIAGTVDMRSARPFDKRGLRSAVTLTGNYRDQNKQWGTTGSAMVSNTWNLGSSGDVGALAGVAFGNTKYTTDAFSTVDMRNFQLKSFQADASDSPNNTGGGSQSTPDTVPSGLPYDQLPAYARSILVPGARIDKAMLLALNPGASIKQIDNALMGRLGRHQYYTGERKRISGILSLQWQPDDQWDVYLDTIVGRKSNEMVMAGMNVGTRANTPIPIGMEFDRSDCTTGCVLTKATLANTFWSLEHRPMLEVTRFGSINPGFEFRATDKVTIDAHFNATNSSFFRDMPTVLLATRSAPTVINYDATGGGVPVYTSNVNVNDPAGFGFYQAGQGLSGVRMNLYERTNSTRGARANLKWGDNNFNIKTGLTFDDIERRYRGYDAAGSWANVVCSGNINYRFFAPNTDPTGTACDGSVKSGALPAGSYPGYGTGYTAGQPALTYQGSIVTNDKVGQYAHPTTHGFIGVDWDKFAKDTDYQYFRDNIYKAFGNNSGGYIREVVTGGYIETNGKYMLFDRALRYNAGVRFTSTEQTIGNVLVQADPRNTGLLNGALYPNLTNWVYEKTTYGNMLPSLTTSYNVTDALIARASLSKSMTRANPADLRQSSLAIGDQGARQGNVTNPNLNPFKSNNFDFALEYYLSREAYLSASAFGKDLIGRPGTRITTYTLAQLDAIYGTVGLTPAQQQSVDASGGRDKHLVEITEPYNLTTKLAIRGYELTWQQPLDMLPIKGFGFTANYTYVKQTDKVPNAPPVAGVPPRTSNLTVYYERNGLTLRMARQYTAGTIVNTSTGLNVPGGAYAYSTPRTQVDLTVGADLKRVFGWKYGPNVTLSVWNLTRAMQHTYTQFPNATFDESKPGRSYNFSLRQSF